jgi:TRAP-type C4-dicarboxylate transport system substrate-binding protein
MDHAERLKGSAFHKKLQEVAHANGIHIMTWWWTPGGFATKDREVAGPGTVKGLKMRAADPYMEIILKEMGASIHSMGSTEIYPALQSGVLDGLMTSAESFVSMRIYEQTRHATAGGDYTLFMLLQPLVMSKQHWDKLTPQQQKIFEAAATKSEAFFNGLQREAAQKMVDTFTKAGNKVRPLSKAEYDAWVAKAKEVAWPKFAGISPTAKELLDLIQKVQ